MCCHKDTMKLTADLLRVFHTSEELANKSLTGFKSNAHKDSQAKQPLNPDIVDVITGKNNHILIL